MHETDPILSRVQEHIAELSERIGARPSGSREEKAAQELIATHLNKSGYSCHYQSFTYPAVPAFFPYLTLPGILLLVISLLPGAWKVLLVGFPFLVAGLPGIHGWLIDRMAQKAHSQNLLALPAGIAIDEVRVMLCAHVDSGRIIPRAGWWMQGILNNYMVILEVYAWLLAIPGLLYITMPSVAEAIQPLCIPVFVFSGFLLIWLDIWQQMGYRGKTSPGANDNASGAALCTALAEEYATVRGGVVEPIGFLFSGAEEAGLFGAKAFVRGNRSDKNKPVVINLDMVGCGKRVGMVTRSGRLKPYNTDARLVQMVRSLEPDALAVDYKYRGGDFIPFAQAGYRAISLEATDHGGVPITYHHASDKAENIQPEVIAKLAHLVRQMIAGLLNEKQP